LAQPAAGPVEVLQFCDGSAPGAPASIDIRERLSGLEARRKLLQGAIAGESPKHAKTAKKKPPGDVQKAREELVGVVLEIDCIQRELWRLASTRDGDDKTNRSSLELTVFYATDRRPNPAARPKVDFGRDRDSAIRYGQVVVSIPSSHAVGELERPSLWKLERADKHFVVKSVVEQSRGEAFDAMKASLASTTAKSLLLFVPGFNNKFTDGALRAAQLSHDLRFPGLTMLYSWPSAGSPYSYAADEEVARYSERSFELVLEDLTTLPFDDIYIVAHSLGSRVAAHGLQRRSMQSKPMAQLKALFLAAADISAEIFRTDIVPHLAAMRGMRTTVYAASSDVLLVVAGIFKDVRRIGESRGGVLTFNGVDTIDASKHSLVSNGFGHSYAMHSTVVLKDMSRIISDRATPSQRGLIEMRATPVSYWLIQ
jgi:esterase/lipase superfamily enzyme